MLRAVDLWWLQENKEDISAPHLLCRYGGTELGLSFVIGQLKSESATKVSACTARPGRCLLGERGTKASTQHVVKGQDMQTPVMCLNSLAAIWNSSNMLVWQSPLWAQICCHRCHKSFLLHYFFFSLAPLEKQHGLSLIWNWDFLSGL